MVGVVIEQAGKLVGARQQVKTAHFMHDARKQGGIGIDVGDAAGNHMRQRRHMGSMFPQLGRLLAQHGIDDLAAELAHHHGRHQRIQVAVAHAHDGGAYAGHGRGVATAVDGRVGQGHGARRQQRFGQHQLDRMVDMAVRFGQGQLQLQGGIHAGREGQFSPHRLGNDQAKRL
ncbi:hypothetical protein D3C81_705280 [compost metagenome]